MGAGISNETTATHARWVAAMVSKSNRAQKNKNSSKLGNVGASLWALMEVEPF